MILSQVPPSPSPSLIPGNSSLSFFHSPSLSPPVILSPIHFSLSVLQSTSFPSSSSFPLFFASYFLLRYSPFSPPPPSLPLTSHSFLLCLLQPSNSKILRLFHFPSLMFFSFVSQSLLFFHPVTSRMMHPHLPSLSGIFKSYTIPLTSSLFIYCIPLSPYMHHLPFPTLLLIFSPFSIAFFSML